MRPNPMVLSLNKFYSLISSNDTRLLNFIMSMDLKFINSIVLRHDDLVELLMNIQICLQ
jgi:hypothetical protein